MTTVSVDSSKTLRAAVMRVGSLPPPTIIGEKPSSEMTNYSDYSDSVYVDSPYDDYQDA